MNAWERAFWEEEQCMQKPRGRSVLGLFKKQKTSVAETKWVRGSIADKSTETTEKNFKKFLGHDKDCGF